MLARATTAKQSCADPLVGAPRIIAVSSGVEASVLWRIAAEALLRAEMVRSQPEPTPPLYVWHARVARGAVDRAERPPVPEHDPAARPRRRTLTAEKKLELLAEYAAADRCCA